MEREEIALEILKLMSMHIYYENRNSPENCARTITNAYNCIYENIKIDDDKS